MRILVQVRSVYGNETVYPVCRLARGFAAIAGTRTLTGDTLREIKAMGFDIEVETPRLLVAGGRV